MLFASVSCEITSRVPHVINKFMGRLSFCVLQVLIPDKVAPICSRSKTLGGEGGGGGGGGGGWGGHLQKKSAGKSFLIYKYILYIRVYTVYTSIY